jgi:Reverse transcriptase (RNA-dependent DNA polymerase).
VEKKDKRLRLCLDARHLNDVIAGDNESPPLISELVQQHHGKFIFTTLDLTHGYWQIPLSAESRPYTAFLYAGTLYQFCRVPFGMKTAGSGFIRAMNLAMGDQFSAFCTCYVDDLLIASRDFAEHLNHLDLVFSCLQRHNFTLRLEKSRFCRTEVPFWVSFCQGMGLVRLPTSLILYVASKNHEIVINYKGF